MLKPSKHYRVLKGAALITFAISFSACQQQAESEKPDELLQTMHQKVTYINSYKMIKKGMINGVEFDIAVMERAVYDAKNGLPPKIPKSEHEKILIQHTQDYLEAKEQVKVEEGERNRKQGKEFLEAYSKEEGVVTTESGLRYRVLTAVEGDGPTPKGDDRVKAHYKSMYIDGTVYRDTRIKDRPETFRLKKMIPGWIEGISMMKVGEKYEFVVPSELAYGEKGANPQVGRNQVLRFEVELLEINPPRKQRKP